MSIENNITVETAKKILHDYCDLHGLSFEKLLSFKPRKSNTRWTWVKPYDGPLTDENGNIKDLQTMPTPIISVNTELFVHEWDGIDLIKP